MSHYLLLTPRDPVIARDGRPFGVNQGTRMRSLAWPYPSVLAGSLRTALGKAARDRFDEVLIKDLQALAIAGPFPWSNGALFLPAPDDMAVREQAGMCEWFRLRPVALEEGEGVDFPGAIGLQPVLLPDDVDDFKSTSPPPWWSRAKLEAWLGETPCRIS